MSRIGRLGGKHSAGRRQAAKQSSHQGGGARASSKAPEMAGSTTEYEPGSSVE
jgi:hypothetical protein